MRKNGLKKLLSFVLVVAVFCSMSVTAFAAETMGSGSTADKATDVVSTLGMFSPAAGSTSVSVDKISGNATVTFTTTPLARQYTKLALVKQSKTDAVKEKAAVKATVQQTADGKYTSTFTITIPVSQLGKKLPISLYQKYTASDGTAVDGWKDFSKQYFLKVNFTAKLVTDLISAIYYQERTAGTDMLCEAAKRGWDSLSEEEQKQVTEFGYYLDEAEGKGGYGYFADETGDAEEDDPLNQDGIGSNELLVCSFGTSYNDSRVATIGGIETELEKTFPTYSVRRGFTSQIIINHIQARDGEMIDNVEQALQRAVANKVKVLVVQPTTLMSGAEYDEMVAAVKKYASKFTQVVYGTPLCSTDSDRTKVAQAVYEAAAAESELKTVEAAKASADTAFVFMGHGTSHSAKTLYTQMQSKMAELGYANAFVGTVEGNPESTSCENVIAAAKAAGYKNVVLRPLMVVAGDHANNDMADPEDDESWYSQFKAAGFNVTCQIAGLGEIEAIQQLYVDHAKAAIAKVVVPKTTTIKKLTAGTKKFTATVNSKSTADGYQIRYSTAKSMSSAKSKSSTGTKFSVTGLKSGKTYYVQVRTYTKTADGTKVYSAWSAAKSVKTK